MILNGENMNTTRLKQVIEYLEEKKRNNFTGSIRISFELGQIVALNEANRHDILTSQIEDYAVVGECFTMASNSLFSGHLSFVFCEGHITDYSYSKTLKGETLRKFFEGK